ncbi:NEDD8 ultimate buster 1 [Pelomyxa schiedti]|nr:NEDD8 ultimate buster 1 [Pelomyxa schiedti]
MSATTASGTSGSAVGVGVTGIAATVKIVTASGTKQVTVQADSSWLGSQLINAVDPLGKIKLLWGGKFIKPDVTLGEQALPPVVRIIALAETSHVVAAATGSPLPSLVRTPPSNSPTQAPTDATASAPTLTTPEGPLPIDVKALASAASNLASRTDGGTHHDEDYFFEIEDQSGRRVPLPDKDRQALIKGLTLQSKGEKLLREGDFSTSLQVFLEADESFSQCDDKILSAVDNYAILCLDVAWCYLKQKCAAFMGDAGWRISRAETYLSQSHGADGHRLKILRNGADNAENVLYVRLKILKAVLSYYTGDLTNAKKFIVEAGDKLQALSVDDLDLAQVMSMGFTDNESRHALRSFPPKEFGIQRAIDFLIQAREEKLAKRTEELLRAAEELRRRTFGRTANGNWIDMSLLKELMASGFLEKFVVEALRQTNNNRDEAVKLLLLHGDLLEPAPPPVPKEPELSDDDSEKIAHLVSLGYSISKSKKALKTCNGDLALASDLLIASAANDPPNSDTATSAEMGDDEEAEADADADPEADAGAEAPVNLITPEEEQRRAAEKDLVHNADTDPNSYLGCSLDDEQSVYNEYSALIFQ